MKKSYLLVGIIFLLMLLPMSGTFAEKKKPKLKLEKAKTTFSTNIPPSSKGTFVRGEEKNLKLVKEYNDLFLQKYVTPFPAKVFKATPLFEWLQPDCSEDSACTITLQNGLKEVITEIKDVKQNSYLLDWKKIGLEPGNEYLFTVKTVSKSDKLNFPIEFYILTKTEKEALDAQLAEIKDANTLEDTISELNFYIDQGLWFDLIDTLNQSLLKDPENKELNKFKKKIYKAI